MRRRLLVIPLLLVLMSGAAADAPAIGQSALPISSNLEVRMGVAESRLDRLDIDMSELKALVPALARVESQLIALNEKASGSADIISSLGLSLATALLGVGIGAMLMGRRQKEAS